MNRFKQYMTIIQEMNVKRIQRGHAEQMERDIVAAYIKWIPQAISDKIFSETAKEVFRLGINWNLELSQDEKEKIKKNFLVDVLKEITKPELLEAFKRGSKVADFFTIDTIKEAIEKEEYKGIIESWILIKYKELFQKKMNQKNK